LNSPELRPCKLLVSSRWLIRAAQIVAVVSSIAPGAAVLASSNKAVPPAQSDKLKSASYLSMAIRDFQIYQYKKAEMELRAAISEDSGNATAHYYLADTLVYLNRHDEAVEEFKRSYRLDPYGPVSGYCRKALLTYNVRIAEPEVEDEPIQATEAIKSYFYSNPKAPSKEQVAAIHDQAEREKLRHKQTGDSLAKAYNTTAERESQMIRSNARDEIDSIINGRLGTSPYPADRQMAATRAESIQRDADEMARIAKKRADDKQDEYKLYSKQRSDLVDEAVSNLEKNLITKNLPGSPQLQHAGTDLFVRNYRPAKSQSLYPDPHQAMARINPPTEAEIDAAKAEQKRLIMAAPRIKREVKGTVVPPSP
jgi:tetratricopeptide (TPR) repeat protein